MSVDDLSPEELDVLAGLQAADPDAADRLAALDGVSRARVVAHLGQAVPPRLVAPIPREPLGSQPGPVVPVRSNRLGWLGWGLLSLAVVVLAVAGYMFYSRLASNDMGNGSSGAPVVVEDGTRTEPSDSALPVSDEDQPETTESSIPDTTSPDTTSADTTSPSTTSPSTTSPSTTSPSTTSADTTSPSTTSPSTTSADTTSPDTTSPDTDGPGDQISPYASPVMATGYAHSCGLRPDRSIECWGNDTLGQLGAPAGAFTAVSAGYAYSCALAVDRSVECWGDNASGQLDAPTGIVTTVSAGGWHTCGLRADGTVECWGDNASGQLDAPTGMVTTVSAGGWHTCGLRADGTVECWGDNISGQLDAPAGRFTAVSAGYAHTCGLRADGTVECWGDNASGQLDAPAGTFAVVSAGSWHSCGLRAGGTVECWGDNISGQLDAPTGRFTAVSAGGVHSCGLRTNRSMECWGEWLGGTSVIATTTTVPEEPDPLEGKFVSVIVSAESPAAAERAREDLEQQYGWDFGILLSDDYMSLRPGYWVVYAGPFDTAAESQDACWTGLRKRSGAECYGRRLSQDIRDVEIVYPPSPG